VSERWERSGEEEAEREPEESLLLAKEAAVCLLCIVEMRRGSEEENRL